MSASVSTEVKLSFNQPAGLFLLFISVVFSTSSHAQEAARHGVMPWSEAVISVSEFGPATRLFRQAGNWRLKLSGQVDRSELDYWKLPDKAKATFERWCAPNSETGCIRFVRFTGVEQKPIRPASRPWDTGGIYSFMIRSDDVPALYTKALELGWWAESPPIRFQFGKSDLRNVVLTGPHGIHVAAYERIIPEFTTFPVGRMSQGFNAMKMVKDRGIGRDFYNKKLGFGILFDSAAEPSEPAYSNLSIPFNYTAQIKRAAAALYPVKGETGRVEVMQIEGFSGRDHSARAKPPNFGIISVRYPVKQLEKYRAFLKSNGVSSSYQAKKVSVAGLGSVNIVAVQDPDGNLTEFYSHGE